MKYFFDYNVLNDVLVQNGILGWNGSWFEIDGFSGSVVKKDVDNLMDVTGGKFLIFARCDVVDSEMNGGQMFKESIPLFVSVDNFSFCVCPAKKAIRFGKLPNGILSKDFREELINRRGVPYLRALLEELKIEQQQIANVSAKVVKDDLNFEIEKIKNEINQRTPDVEQISLF